MRFVVETTPSARAKRLHSRRQCLKTRTATKKAQGG